MRRILPTLALLALAAAVAEAKDLRTAMIRLVPEADWKPSPGPVAVAVENQATHEKAAEFAQAFDKWVRQAFPELDHPLDDQASTRVRFVIEEFDPGKAALRWVVGFGAGKSYVRGVMTVEQGGKPVGELAFTGRPRSVSPDGMARELAPAVVLKLHNGERDTELHEPNKQGGEEQGEDG
jgi:hypothetical protein